MHQTNFIAVTYDVQNSSYTDTRHQAEIMLTPEWLNKVERVEILPTLYGEPPKTMTQKKGYKELIINTL